MKRVTGIGGIFFKSENPEALRQWYQTHLGIDVNEYGAMFMWKHSLESNEEGYTLWSPFANTTNYFKPSEKEFMLNYTVADIETLVTVLKEEGVTVLDEIATYEYGKFVHILDLEGNKIELWQSA